MVEMSSEDRAVLEERGARALRLIRRVVRARIVLLDADGVHNVDIAACVGCVSILRRSGENDSAKKASRGLADRARSGRPRRFGPRVVAGIKALAVSR